jgi:hypothetical protein
MRQLIGWMIGLPIVVTIISLVLNVFLAGLLVLTYSSLTQEKTLATIRFNQVENKEYVYIAHIYDDTGSLIDICEIYGDQWRMDAVFIKMEYWANIFGLDSKYALNRFEGRYKDIDQENNSVHKAYQLESQGIIDTFSFFVDATYGSSVYQDIKLNTEYTVLKSQTGLMVREKHIEQPEESFYDKATSWIH